MRYSSGADSWNSIVSVQNAGSGDAVVTISYRDRVGNAIAATSADTRTLKAGATWNIRQADRTELGNSFIGSAVVTSSTSGAKLAAVTQIANNFNDSTHAQYFSFGARAAGATRLFAPRLTNNYYGNSSGLQIQNLGSTTANVTLRFKFGGTSLAPQTVQIPPSVANTYYLPSSAAAWGIPSGHSAGKGSAIIESDQPIIAIVNEDTRIEDPSAPGRVGQGDSYNAFADGRQTTVTYLPKISALYFGYASAITVMNAGTGTATITIKLTHRTTGETQTFTRQIGEGDSGVYFVPDLWGKPDFDGSAVVTSTSGQGIFAIADISCRADKDSRCTARFGDSFSMYTGINQ
jgi:hypothetical protein